ncbi:hypothetical protein AB1Y20_004690 [Prymnesium parvum]|uniref:Microbial-type PARG catalytic domain-containing protein n=1 Tax=Prymnesium parvum TaxID=97485 RepID=A0AB34IXN8_PRYPA
MADRPSASSACPSTFLPPASHGAQSHTSSAHDPVLLDQSQCDEPPHPPPPSSPSPGSDLPLPHYDEEALPLRHPASPSHSEERKRKNDASCLAVEEHRFVWDDDLEVLLEHSAHGGGSGYSREQLAAIAAHNYRLVRSGYCTDASSGTAYSLGTEGMPNRTHEVSTTAQGRPLQPPHHTTRIAVARVDTASALRALSHAGRPAAALNFANAHHVGGGYLRGARAQEEDLCRLMPPLFSQLKQLRYPLHANTCHYTHTWLARAADTYEVLGPPVRVAVLSSAMPNMGGHTDTRKYDHAGSEAWRQTVRLRIRAVLHAAAEEKHETLLLGAFGCGAFRNPPDEVARAFAHVLASHEFRGKFSTIAFAIMDPKQSDQGNFAAFRSVFHQLCSDL